MVMSRREAAAQRRITGFLSIAKQEHLASLTQGIDLSRYSSSGGRVYSLCTTCGGSDGVLGLLVFGLAGFLGLLMVKAEKRRRLFVATGQRPGTGPGEIKDLGLLLILLSGAALFTGHGTYLLGFIPLWTAALVFLPIGLICLFGSKSRLLNVLIKGLDRRMVEAGLSREAVPHRICPHCRAPNSQNATSCAECGSIMFPFDTP
jgi:hypothetical protein